MVTGIYGSCCNIGNIIGLQSAGFFLHDGKSKIEFWGNLMIFTAILFSIDCFFIIFVFKPDP